MHPLRPLVAVGLVTGRVQIFDAGAAMSTPTEVTAGAAATAAASPLPPPPPLVNLRASSSSARAISFSADGSALYVGDAEGNLTSVDVATGKASARLAGASGNGSAFTRLVAALLSSNNASSSFLPATSVISGDEGGTVRVWDPRSSKPAVDFSNVHEGEQVSDVLLLPASAAAGLKSSNTNTSESVPASTTSTSTTGGLVSVGGDGTLALLDFARAGGRQGGGVASRSDPDEDELLCLAPAKNFSTLCAGSAGGVLSLWKPKAAGGLAGYADRLPLPRLPAKEGGERPAINSLTPLDGGRGGKSDGGVGGLGGGGSLLVAGCADGNVRVLSVLPNRVLCTLAGGHGDGREVLRVRAGGGGSASGSGEVSASSPCTVAASVAAPSKSLCLWSCEALRASAASAASAVTAGVGGKRARRRQAEEDDESSDEEDEDNESDEEDAAAAAPAAPKMGEASRPGAASFFDGIVP